MSDGTAAHAPWKYQIAEPDERASWALGCTHFGFDPIDPTPTSMQVSQDETDLFDVILATNRIGDAPSSAVAGARPIQEPHELSRGVCLGPVDDGLTEVIIHSCLPPGENFYPVVHDTAHYGFFRSHTYDGHGKLYGFDPTRDLALAVRLSRLVHPTSVSREYAARVISTPATSERQIVPASARGFGANAYVIDTASDWLTDEHAGQIGELFRGYDHQTAPTRLKIALFYFEYAAWTYYVDLRWTLLASAAEALVHVEGERDPKHPSRFAGSTQQFISRMLGISSLIPGLAFTESDLRGMYRARSGVVHGQEYEHQDPEIQRLYALLESSLRTILRSIVLNQELARLFETDQSVQAAFPL